MFQGLLISKNLAVISPVFIFYKLSSGGCLPFRIIYKTTFWIRFFNILENFFIIKTLCMYILPHFDVDFQTPLLIKYNELGSIVILMTVEVSH